MLSIENVLYDGGTSITFMLMILKILILFMMLCDVCFCEFTGVVVNRHGHPTWLQVWSAKKRSMSAGHNDGK